MGSRETPADSLLGNFSFRAEIIPSETLPQNVEYDTRQFCQRPSWTLGFPCGLSSRGLLVGSLVTLVADGCEVRGAVKELFDELE